MSLAQLTAVRPMPKSTEQWNGPPGSVILVFMTDVTQILSQIEQGDPSAAEQLLPLVYDELKNLAALKMAAERPDHTLQATALVNEAYLRLVGPRSGQPWDSRGHFFVAAAEAMRRVLINHARDRATAKRGADWRRVTLSAITTPGGIDPAEFAAVDDMLKQLEQQDRQAGQIAKLRIFTGLTIPEIASLLNLGRRSVDRQWAFARAWLRAQLMSGESRSDDLS